MKFQTLTAFIVEKQSEFPGATGELTRLLNDIGKASDGFRHIFDIQPKELHERSPLFVGPTAMVEKAEEFMQKHSPEFRPG